MLCSCFRPLDQDVLKLLWTKTWKTWNFSFGRYKELHFPGRFKAKIEAFFRGNDRLRTGDSHLPRFPIPAPTNRGISHRNPLFLSLLPHDSYDREFCRNVNHVCEIFFPSASCRWATTAIATFNLLRGGWATKNDLKEMSCEGDAVALREGRQVPCA